MSSAIVKLDHSLMPQSHPLISYSSLFKSPLSIWTVYSPNLPSTPHAGMPINFHIKAFLFYSTLTPIFPVNGQNFTHSVHYPSALSSYCTHSCFLMVLSIHPPLLGFLISLRMSSTQKYHKQWHRGFYKMGFSVLKPPMC